MEVVTELRDGITNFFDWFACNLDTGVMCLDAPAISGLMKGVVLFADMKGMLPVVR